MLSFSAVSNSLWPVDCSPPGSLSIEFSMQEYESGLPFLPPGDLSNSRIQPRPSASPELAGRFFATAITEDHIYIIQSPYYQPIWEHDEINNLISFTEEWKEAHMNNMIYKQIFTDRRVRIRTVSQVCPELTGLPSVMSRMCILSSLPTARIICFLTYQTATSSKLKLSSALSVKPFSWLLTNPKGFFLQAYSLVAFITL